MGADFSGHGGYSCGGGDFTSHIAAGDDSAGDCTPDSNDGNVADQDWLFGNGAGGDLGIVLLDACNTMQKCVWNNSGYADVDGANLRMLGGYHGLSYDNNGQVDALEDYVNAAHTSGAGGYWLTYRYTHPIGSDNDQCPTVMIWGEDQTARDDFYAYGGIDDRLSTGTHNGSTVYFIVGCDPAAGEEL